MTGENDTWPQWRVDRLRDLWTIGKTASQIAVLLGGGLTRNAVVGKAHRMGLIGRPSPIVRDGRGRQPRAPKTRQPAAEGHLAVLQARERSEQAKTAQRLHPPVVPPAPPPRPVLERVSQRTCAWPIGDPKKPGFHFCGATPVLEGDSYCAPHQAGAYQKSTHASAAFPVPRDDGGARKWAR
jgi:GcrA cell cycle regulator